MLYLVAYDLKRPVQNYSGLFVQIKQTGQWWHYLDSLWIVKSPESLEIFRNRLFTAIDKNDHIIVIDITNKSWNGWLVPEAWNWLNSNRAG